MVNHHCVCLLCGVGYWDLDGRRRSGQVLLVVSVGLLINQDRFEPATLVLPRLVACHIAQARSDRLAGVGADLELQVACRTVATVSCGEPVGLT